MVAERTGSILRPGKPFIVTRKHSESAVYGVDDASTHLHHWNWRRSHESGGTRHPVLKPRLSPAAAGDQSRTTTPMMASPLTTGTYAMQVQTSRPLDRRSKKVSGAGASLQAQSFRVLNPVASVGQAVTAQFQLRNTGTQATGPVQVSFYLSSDSTITKGDRRLGTYTVNSLAPKSSSAPLRAALRLPGANDFFWQTNGSYQIGMLVKSQTASQSKEKVSSRRGIRIDRDQLRVSGIPANRPFNIEFDYSRDTSGWFTPARRAVLAAAAQVWEKIIRQDFFGAVDLRISVTAVAFKGATLAEATSGSSFRQKGSIEFSRSGDWFFDSTPNTADDIPADRIDFMSVALHEIGHSLGFAASDSLFSSQVSNHTFVGKQAKQANGGKPVPLDSSNSHIRRGYQYNHSGTTLMDPIMPYGKRLLPTALDLAIFSDLGFQVDRSLASRNR